MKIVIFGLTISSSWGNGHATLWRGLCRALIGMGHDIVFYERDVPYYAAMRDLTELSGGRLQLYDAWENASACAGSDMANADVAIITSYCPDSIAAGRLVVAQRRALRVFYDLDTPVTLARLAADQDVPYIDLAAFPEFDLVLSFTGGRALGEFRSRLGATNVEPLYGHVDPDLHRPAAPLAHYQAGLSYLGTYSEDRQRTLEALLVSPARRCPGSRFLIAGAQYPQDFPWSPNIYFVRHLPPAEHAAFFCSSRLTLNVTRRAMAEMGWCPSGRLFEAAACGVPLVTDTWEGLDSFFCPDDEIIIARDTDEVIEALRRDDGELLAMARRARERTLDEHSSTKRAAELLELIQRSPRSECDRLISAEA